MTQSLAMTCTPSQLHVRILMLLAVALGSSFGEANSCQGGNLLQLNSQKGQQLTSEEERSSWVTGPYGPCMVQCGGGTWRTRDVECRSFEDGGLLEDRMCLQAALPRPGWRQDCNCEVSPCAQAICDGPELPREVSESSTDELANIDFECVGCYPLLEDDHMEEIGEDARDLACMGWNSSSPCRSGLPFYRMRSNLLTPNHCFEFCLGLGLDIFGLVQGMECRCGASQLNRAVWGSAGPKVGLRLPALSESCMSTNTSTCSVRVYRYSGPMISGAVPATLLEASSEDMPYVDSIVAGRHISQEEAEDGAVEADSKGDQAPASLLDSLSGPSWERLCSSSHGCLSGQKWPDRDSPEGPSTWEEHTTIPYVFEAGLDATRKEAFRLAVDHWREKTCISLVERSSANGYYVRVGAFNSGSSKRLSSVVSAAWALS
mmetsp:Transcript_18569/g.32514  ORF Transcript_18569/g.32514 Transcript_18569/m.32514 type:complete len:432 (+) Transcript_18569:15-1310(+)